MHGEDFFTQALVYLLAAVISVPVAKRLGLGSVLGYLLAGIIIGPFVLGLVGEEGTDVMHFAEFGVVMMLFLIGLELQPSLLWKMRKSIFGLGGLQVAISTLVIGTIAFFITDGLSQALAIGLILALSSTAIILQTLNEKGLMKSQAGQSSFSVLLFQDIAVIPILAVLPLLGNEIASQAADHGAHHGAESLAGWQQVLLIIITVSAIIFLGRFVARHIFRLIAETRMREIFTATALLLVIAISLAMTKVGLSPALGAFLAGVVLADNEYRHELETDIEPFKGLLLGLFFIAVGAGIDFRLLVEIPGVILGLLGLLLVAKFLVLLLLAKVFKIKAGQGLLFSLALAQGGEFAFVLISFSLQNNILSQSVGETLILVTALSMAITPLFFLLYDKVLSSIFEQYVNKDEPDEIDETNDVIIAGFGRFGMVVGRMLFANGIKATVLDNNPSQIRVLRRFGFKVFYGDASRPDLLENAGAEEAKVLIVAVDEPEKVYQITEHAKHKYPHLKILARARGVPESYRLKEMNPAYVKRETYDASLDMGRKALTMLGFNEYQAVRAVKAFRYHDGNMMNELFKHWGEDKHKYGKRVRQFTEQLEQILQAEQNASLEQTDAAWDNTTLREEIKELFEEKK